uniref:Uncharacterized protein n=1 Tax=Oryza nivara TaxID=4536 RepID=A0A0E0GWS2_ORYNI
MSTATSSLWITPRPPAPPHHFPVSLGMKSNTRALNSLPSMSMLEQQVTMLIRFRCLTLRSASHSAMNVLEAPTCRRSSTFTATTASSRANSPFVFSDRVPLYTDPYFPAPTRLASAKSSVAFASSAYHAASGGVSGSRTPDLAAPPERGEHHGEAKGRRDDRQSDLEEEMSSSELMVSRLAGMPPDRSFRERYSSCSPGIPPSSGGMLPDNLLPVRFSLLSPFSPLRDGGMLPTNTLRVKSRNSKLWQLSSSVGTSPEKRFPDNAMNASFVSWPTSGGIGPSSWLSDKSISSDSDERVNSSLGTWPVSSLPERLSSVS